jgi:hypothetical protein
MSRDVLGLFETKRKLTSIYQLGQERKATVIMIMSRRVVSIARNKDMHRPPLFLPFMTFSWEKHLAVTVERSLNSSGGFMAYLSLGCVSNATPIG